MERTSPQMTMEETNTLKLIQFYMDGIVLIFVIVLGLIGNVLTIAALATTSKIHPPMRVILSCLAVSDMVVLLSSMLLISLPELVPEYNELVLPYVIVYVYPVALVAQTCGTWFIVAITVLRAIAICCSLRAPILLSKRHIHLTTAGIVVLSVIVNVTRWFEYEIADTFSDTGSKYKVRITELGSNSTYNTLYYLYFYTAVMMSFPLMLLTISNTLLIKSAKESRKNRKIMSRQRRTDLDVNLTIMIVSVISVFILCHVPAYVYNVAYSLNSGIRHNFSWEVISSVRNLLVTLNSAINFVLYCVSGRTFRNYFINMFPCQRKKILKTMAKVKDYKFDSLPLDCNGRNSFLVYDRQVTNDFIDI